ncbi:MAG: 2-hydroxyacyl-CoA dehydratase family protein [Proteobacteria bacterium]|nr:2-hydroxyacyl-CoA dehydratase family protein [Pseudomonadota bacterium]MBU1741942.1 2-hydroxyacyl-CoA dehydratase family protein [Pseudomonadota bacterium]
MDYCRPAIREIVRTNTNRHLEAWRAAGRPVVGYFCRYVPWELILAAGALPVRLRGAGSADSSLGDAFLSGRVCTFVRHVVSLALEGAYDFLDGVISTNGCDHVRRAADVFQKKTAVPWQGFVSVPRSPRENLLGYYLRELGKIKSGLETHFGTEITPAKLRRAVALGNQVRQRLSRVNDLRLPDGPKLTGAEALAVHVAAQVVPPRVFLDLADELLADLTERPGLAPPRGRLVLIGAELDEPDYLAAIERQGALVVADRLCFGARIVLDPVDENGADPLAALARAYFLGPSCARMIGDFPRRWDELVGLVRSARADGVVFQRLVFCDPWGAEGHNLLHRLKRNPAFPLLSLEREYGVVPTGQVATRVQAFLEKIEIARARGRGPRAAETGA